MPKKDDAPALAVCDGCGMERADVAEPNDRGMAYCPDCAERRADDPHVTVQGRALTVSELIMQAEDDEDLAAALPGDSLQELIDNKQTRAKLLARAEELKAAKR